MIWALWAASAVIIAVVAYAFGWHRADTRRRPQPVPALLRQRAEEYEAKSREHLARNALADAKADAKAAFEKAVQLRTAANLMEEVK